MYKCGECGAVFENFKQWHQDGGCYEADYGVYGDFASHNYYSAIDWEGCPECGADVEQCRKLEECKQCGELVKETYDGLCESCCE